ncbi:DUF932 domain-containing protein [Streptacidiphilus monticola]|uniref:DUF932 domain-containing protein n=1 Tax=Streptacidiphilus monticola TaxID=2161674 RepID=A0ABW1GC44_9ACTN
MQEQLTARAAVVTPQEGGTGPARNASLADIAQALTAQQGRKLDMVVNASALRSEGGIIRVAGVEPEITADGVTLHDRFRPTEVADEGISEKLRIPLAYLRRMRAEVPDLYDANVNAWLAREAASRRFMLRTFTGKRDEPGTLRAFVSDQFKVIDNLDVLLAVLGGIKESGHEVTITGCDLTDRRMVVRIESEEVRAHAPALLKGYRSPFTGQSGDDLPIVSAGLVIANSEVGNGAYTITPRIVVQVCTNGLTITKDVIREVHVGAKLDHGIIRWSHETQRKNVELITAQSRDAVATFLDRAYVEAKLREIEEQAGKPVTDPAKTVEVISKRLKFTDTVRESVLNHFIRGGQVTAGGILQAITATAQTLPDGDAAYELEGQALTAMALV